ncbi:MAG TPA: hypothetical protein VFW40_05675, partial [Capsulimonadaceae bacterium]|nr:hypothetical protein [Capsulimonadaceae bacterium]
MAESRSGRPSEAVERQNLPWTAFVAVLLAIAALEQALGFSFLLPLLALALLASYFVSFRITAPWLHWLIRIGIYGIIVTLNLGNLGSEPVFMIDSGTLQVLCFICLAELVLQCWIKQRDKGSLGVVIFLTGLVFLLGCTTWDETAVRFLAPAYMLFAILSLPGFRTTGPSSGRK